MDYTHSNTGKESQTKTFPSATAEEIQGLTSNPENFLFRGHIKCINSTILIAAMYIHCIPVCTFLFILLFIKATVYCPAYLILLHILFLFIFIHFLLHFLYLYLCIFSCVSVTYNCTVHGADLTYISLLVIFCIIVHVMNKNLES